MEPHKHHTHIGDSLSPYRPSVCLTLEERLRHMALIGATGSGKSVLLRHTAQQDAMRDGLLLIDGHGDLAEAVLGDVPRARHNHVAYVNLAELDHPVGWNVLEDVAPDHRAFVVDGVVSAMRAIWVDSWGERLGMILRHACAALLEVPNASLVLLPRLLTDSIWRARAMRHVQSPLTRAFFENQFAVWRDSFRDEAVVSVINRVDSFLFSPHVRNILGQGRSTVHLSHAMQHGRIVILNLAAGIVGDSAARLFGALVVAQVRTAAMARASMPEAQRRPFHVILDEAQNYNSQAVVGLLSEVRKYGCSLTMATQFLDGLGDATRAALLGNARTLVAFRCSPTDAAVLAPHFDDSHQSFNPVALQEAAIGEAWVNGMPVRIPAPQPLRSSEVVKRQSRLHFGTPRAVVEANIQKVLGHRH